MDNIPADAHTREVFYVGGEYVDDGVGNETVYGQVYVEHLVPVRNPPQKYPIVFIPGSSRTGIDFLTTPSIPTPDKTNAGNNPSPQSWSSHFLSLSHELYLIDPPFRGRSPWHPPTHLSSPPTSSSSPYLTFGAAPLRKAWTTPPSSTQWPDDDPSSPAGKGSPAFDHVMKSTHPQLAHLAEEQAVAQKSLAVLLDKINKPIILLAHSMGCKIAWLLADARPKLVRAIIAVEPAGPAFQMRGMGGLRKELTAFGLTEARLGFEPEVGPNGEGLRRRLVKPKEGEPGLLECWLQGGDDDDDEEEEEEEKGVRRLANLRGVEVLVVTGEGSPHRGYDWGTVEFLRQAGVEEVEHLVLRGEGVMKGRGGGGNGHMMMLERNRGGIGEILGEWVRGRG
ncbi:Alpha/Beta hydrolase protein [Triangularia setosa]|uniref:Alpha/Beta hydrolase protein n=1 Tax=Triangularia setosa TaxID=2587417 RepID=A0AAN6W6V9_9PEZI|nr:Alpha/Beta hydrolase protein [Podospora setosa]